MGRSGEWWSLSGTDRWLVLSAAALLATSRLALLVARPAVVRRLVDQVAPALPPSRRVGDPDRIAAAVRTAARRLPVEAACLGNAIVARAMLAANDHDAALRIGVAKDGPDDLSAHAWVERDGRVLVGDLPDLGSYRPLAADGGEQGRASDGGGGGVVAGSHERGNEGPGG